MTTTVEQLVTPALEAELDELAAGCRILHEGGHAHMALGHAALCDPHGCGVWTTRSEIGLGEVRGADDFLLLDFDGAQRARLPCRGVLDARRRAVADHERRALRRAPGAVRGNDGARRDAVARRASRAGTRQPACRMQLALIATGLEFSTMPEGEIAGNDVMLAGLVDRYRAFLKRDVDRARAVPVTGEAADSLRERTCS